MASDELDILDFDEAKQAVNMSTARAGSDDATTPLELAITAISRVIDDLRGPVVARDVEGEIHDGGGWFIVPEKQPVLSITTVTEYNGTVPTVLAAEHFPTTTSSYGYWLKSNGALYRRSGGAYSIFGGTLVIIDYRAGRFESTETVDQQYKKCAAEILQGNWSKFSAVWARGGDPFADPTFFDEVRNTLNRWLPLSDREPSISG